MQQVLMGIHNLAGRRSLCKGALEWQVGRQCKAEATDPLPELLEELGPLPGATSKASDEPT